MLLYVLECEPVNNKPTWYIGVSYALNNRIAQHCSGRGSAWVRLHPCVRIHEVIMNATLAMEKEVTLDYMRRFGWSFVRGGPYSKPFMRRPPKELRYVPDLNPVADNVVRAETHVAIWGSTTYAEAAKSADAAETKQPVGVLQV